MPISTLATRISTVSIWETGGGATTGAGGGSDLPARSAATPPAARATPRTTRRAVFIRFTSHDHAHGAGAGPSQVISPAKRQSMVNEAYLNRVNRKLNRAKALREARGSLDDLPRRLFTAAAGQWSAIHEVSG